MADLKAAIRVETISGSTHEFTADFKHYRRVNTNAALRDDDKWLPLLEDANGRTMPRDKYDIDIGLPLVIMLVGLGDTPMTNRRTADVVSVNTLR